jgi:hypothetical protein
MGTVQKWGVYSVTKAAMIVYKADGLCMIDRNRILLARAKQSWPRPEREEVRRHNYTVSTSSPMHHRIICIIFYIENEVD